LINLYSKVTFGGQTRVVFKFQKGRSPSENYVTGKKVPFHYPAGRRLTATATDSPRCAATAATAEEACHDAFKNSTNSACHTDIRRTRRQEEPDQTKSVWMYL